MQEIYFDNSATTNISSEVKNEMIRIMDYAYGNPSSLHFKGLEAKRIISEAKKNILRSAGADGYRLVFTSSGTEANNLAIIGTYNSKDRFKNGNIVISDSEHECVYRAAKRLESKGVDVRYLHTKNGVIDVSSLDALIDKKTFLISVMHVNNETGALYDIKNIFDHAKELNSEIITHCDMVQSFGKIKTDLKSFHVDLATISSHKIHGPKGAGALFISEKIITSRSISPVTFGGGQEYNLRSGTENTLAIAGFAKACESAGSSIIRYSDVDKLRSYLILELSKIKGITINEPANGHAPHILSVSTERIKSETLLNYLSKNGICVSSGSACSSNKEKENRVLKAFGLSNKTADTTIRISLCEYNTRDEADIFVNKISEAMTKLSGI